VTTKDLLAQMQRCGLKHETEMQAPDWEVESTMYRKPSTARRPLWVETQSNSRPTLPA